MLYTKSKWWTLVAQEPFLPVFQENFDAVCRNNKQKKPLFQVVLLQPATVYRGETGI